ncbi:MAG: uncharacterized protein KVP18_002522 [Porospora cf. gigantea A]|uniref:uncharacterized protein n=1 Tax=Porospora cf. gigantea A TaxID=2853593 RepID=UPI00355957D1|nr:MAG: hypothetical protein KVP18_002522 [Porospora cf. gigantea A]
MSAHLNLNAVGSHTTTAMGVAMPLLSRAAPVKITDLLRSETTSSTSAGSKSYYSSSYATESGSQSYHSARPGRRGLSRKAKRHQTQQSQIKPAFKNREQFRSALQADSKNTNDKQLRRAGKQLNKIRQALIKDQAAITELLQERQVTSQYVTTVAPTVATHGIPAMNITQGEVQAVQMMPQAQSVFQLQGEPQAKIYQQVQVQPTQVQVQPTQVQVQPVQCETQVFQQVQVQPTHVQVQPTHVQVQPTQVQVQPTQVQVQPTQVQAVAFQAITQAPVPTQSAVYQLRQPVVQQEAVMVSPVEIQAEAVQPTTYHVAVEEAAQPTQVYFPTLPAVTSVAAALTAVSAQPTQQTAVEIPPVVQASIRPLQANQLQMAPIMLVAAQPEIIQSPQSIQNMPFYFRLNITDEAGSVRSLQLGSANDNVKHLQNWCARHMRTIQKLLKRAEEGCYRSYQGGAVDAGAKVSMTSQSSSAQTSASTSGSGSSSYTTSG